MTINQQQFDQLTEMGISLWQSKRDEPTKSALNSMTARHKKVHPEKSYVALNNTLLTELCQQQCFIDILQLFDITIGEVTLKNNHLDCGLFNWYFTTNTFDKSSPYCMNNNLFSPSIALITQSPALKKRLWQTIINQLL